MSRWTAASAVPRGDRRRAYGAGVAARRAATPWRAHVAFPLASCDAFNIVEGVIDHGCSASITSRTISARRSAAVPGSRRSADRSWCGTLEIVLGLGDDRLSIYLNDHLAAATAGANLARRAAGSNEGTDYGTVLEAVANEIEDDRAALADVM